MRTASTIRRAFAVFAAVILVGATLVPEDADARAGRGGSFGSRGARTFDAAPPTATAPGAAPMQRSITQPGGFQNPAAQAGRTAQAPSRGLFGGGLGAGLMGGLLGAGLFGLLAGNGFFGGLGSLSSILGLLIQVGLIILVVKLVMNWMRRRQQPAAAAAGGAPYGMAQGGADQGRPQAVARQGFGFPGSGGSNGAGFGLNGARQDEPLELEAADFDVFERLLTDVQDAWTQQDLSRLRGLATPEMVEMFGEDLAEDASRGVVNKVTGVKLLQGDLAESWRERDRDYATVAMRYELVDVTEDRDSGRVVEGDPRQAQEATELWTFVRAANGGRWLLSAIQQAA